MRERLKSEGASDFSEVPGNGRRRCKSVVDHADFASWDWNIGTGAATYNEQWAGILGYDPDEIQWHFNAWKKRVHPDDLPAVLEAANAHLSGSKSVYQAEYRMRHRSGRWIWVQSHGRIYERRADGTPLRVTGIHNDITDRREAEDALHLSREMYKHNVELTNQIPWVADTDGANINCDPAWEAYTGLSIETVRGDKWLEVVHRDDRDQVIARWRHSVVTGQRYSVSHRLRRKDGQYRYCESRAQPQRDEAGEIIRWYGTTQDVHERAVAEELLRASEARSALALEGANLATWDWDIRSGEVIRNAAWFEMLGFEPDGNCDSGFWTDRIHPDEKAAVKALWEAHCRNESRPFRAEHRIRHKSGEWRWIITHGRVVERDASGPVRACGVSQDITERRTFEDALARERFSGLLLESHQDCVALLDSSGGILYMNPAGLKRMGNAELEVVLGRSWISLWAGERRGEIQENVRLAYTGQTTAFQSRWGDDSELPGWWDVLLSPVTGSSDQPTSILAVARDITRFKEQEERQRETVGRKRLQTILEDLNEGIIIAKPNGVVRLMNRAASVMFGFDPGSGQAIHCDDLFSAVDAIGLSDQAYSSSGRPLARAMAGEAFSGVETLLLTRRNGRKWVASCGSTPVRSESGELIFAVLSLRDVTGERRAAEEIQTANLMLHRLTGQLLHLQDEEHRRIARELHDGTVQILSAALMNLSLLSELPALRKLRFENGLVARTQEFTNQAVKELRTLSYLLHPPVLDELGLVPAVRSWLDGFSERTGIPVDISMPLQMDRLSPEMETALFRIVQEAVGNVHRHAHASHASVRLKVENGGVTELEIMDDGRGFNAVLSGGAQSNRKAGVGLLGMRERATQLGGSFSIESQPGKTVIRVTLPEKHLRLKSFAS